MKLCILGVWQNAHKFIRQLAMFCMLSSLCVLFYMLLYIGCNHLILQKFNVSVSSTTVKIPAGRPTYIMNVVQ